MRTYSVLIIGSGFGGQCAAINLLKQGETDFRMLERRSFMGGTWCQNTYPGAAVDVHSPLYSISSEPYQWTQMFAEQHELNEYTNYVIDKHGLRDKTELDAEVTQVKWNESTAMWELTTKDKGVFTAQVLINASGPLSTPVIPDFKGRERFKGKSFHTNGWDHSYDYRGKRVAIIGSGASAAQVIPEIAPSVGHLHVFQRTPHWVLPRPDRKFSKFQQRLLGIAPLHAALRTGIYWSLETRVIGFKYSKELLNKYAQQVSVDFLNEQVADPELRRKLLPDYTIGCKRIILSSTLYPALCRDNVTLRGRDQGIAEITETGIITAEGEHIELDLIIYATGYDATDGAVSYPIIGRNGLSVGEFWKQYPHAYLGTALPNFPNFFVVTGPNTGIGHTSALFIIESQMLYIMRCIKELRDKQARSIEVKAEAESTYTTMIHKEMERTVWKTGGCKSWYMSKSGHVIAMFPGFSFTYRGLTKSFKPNDHMLT